MPASTGSNLGLSHSWTLGESGWNTLMDNNLKLLDALVMIEVLSATTTAEPGSPTAGDRYIIPTSATGTNWAGQDGKLARYDGITSAWEFYAPKNGYHVRALDTKIEWVYESAAWVQRLVVGSSASGITASATQTQGQQPLTANINEVSTVGVANDVVTLPALLAGMGVTVINNGANTLQIFPASGEDLGAGVNTSVTLAAGAAAKFEAYSAGVAFQII